MKGDGDAWLTSHTTNFCTEKVVTKIPLRDHSQTHHKTTNEYDFFSSCASKAGHELTPSCLHPRMSLGHSVPPWPAAAAAGRRTPGSPTARSQPARGTRPRRRISARRRGGGTPTRARSSTATAGAPRRPCPSRWPPSPACAPAPPPRRPWSSTPVGAAGAGEAGSWARPAAAAEQECSEAAIVVCTSAGSEEQRETSGCRTASAEAPPPCRRRRRLEASERRELWRR